MICNVSITYYIADRDRNRETETEKQRNRDRETEKQSIWRYGDGDLNVGSEMVLVALPALLPFAAMQVMGDSRPMLMPILLHQLTQLPAEPQTKIKHTP